MTRVVIFLLAVGVIALAAAWFADRPGGVEIVWLNYRVSTSVAVLVAVVLLLIAAAIFLWSILRSLLRTPGKISESLRVRRVAKGERAITRGLIAIGAGDLAAAKRYAGEAKRLAGGEPLTLLLSAQSAQLAGDRAAAEDIFRSMAERPDLKSIGLHGLFVEARRRNDIAAAYSLAEEALTASPSLGWAGQAVLEFRCASGDWRAALDALERNSANGLIDKPRYRRQRAVLLTAQAQTLAETSRDQAAALATEAAKLAPDLVPAAALAGRTLADGGNIRKASRIVDTAWKVNPHPDLAEIYINLRPGDSARERLARAQKLAKQPAGHLEGALALARAAIDAQSFALARAALAPFISAPTQRVALLMAELEEAESGDVGRARAWTARAVHAAQDPAWTADGFVSEQWMPVSPATGRLDAFEWKVPLAELPGTVIEQASEDMIEADEKRPTLAASAPATAAASTEAEPATVPRAAVAARPTVTLSPRPRQADMVIPLVHAPDDPGPEDDEPEPVAATPESRSRWRDLFR